MKAWFDHLQKVSESPSYATRFAVHHVTVIKLCMSHADPPLLPLPYGDKEASSSLELTSPAAPSLPGSLRQWLRAPAGRSLGLARNQREVPLTRGGRSRGPS